jgi:hypothetical protein
MMTRDRHPGRSAPTLGRSELAPPGPSMLRGTGGAPPTLPTLVGNQRTDRRAGSRRASHPTHTPTNKGLKSP